MNCKQCKKLINAYLDGYLPAQRERELFTHLDSCVDCQQYYDEMFLIYENLEDVERDVPLGFRANWRTAVEESSPKKKGINFKVMIPAFAACVCGLFVITAVVRGQPLNQLFSVGEIAGTVQSGGETEAPATFYSDPAQQTAQEGAATGQAPPNDVQNLLEESQQQGVQENADAGAAEGAVDDVKVKDTLPQATAPAQSTETPSIAEDSAASVQSITHPIIDAQDKHFRQELIDYAKETGVLSEEELNDKSVFLKGKPEDINKVLQQFGFEPIVAVEYLEIVFGIG